MDIKLIIDDYKFKVRVSGILIVNNKLLTTKYGVDKYCLPGGYVEIGETSSEAIKRELEEELQVEINVDKFLGIAENFFVNFKKEKTHGLEFYYLSSFKNKTDINFNDYELIENDKNGIVKHSFKWLDIKNIDNFNLVPPSIKNAIKNKEFSNVFHIIEK